MLLRFLCGRSIEIITEIVNPMKGITVLGTKVNKRAVVRWKIYLDRARMYLSYINFVMIAFVFLNAIKDQQVRDLLDQNKLLVYPTVMIVFIVVSLLLGRLDTWLGMRKEEMRNHATENPVTLEILTTLREIKARLDDPSLELSSDE